jgi:hypothetical protein
MPTSWPQALAQTWDTTRQTPTVIEAVQEHDHLAVPGEFQEGLDRRQAMSYPGLQNIFGQPGRQGSRGRQPNEPLRSWLKGTMPSWRERVTAASTTSS